MVESKAIEGIVDEFELKLHVTHATDAIASFRHFLFSKGGGEKLPQILGI